MKGNSTLNMTQGKPTGLLLRFAIPMLIGNIFQQMYSLADSVIVGQFLGANALAAIGSTGSVTFLFFSICNGISSGSGIVTSQYFGAGDPNNTKRAIANAAYIMFAASLVMGVISFLAAQCFMTAYQLLSEPLMSLFVKEAEVITMGAQALRLTSWFYLFLALIYMTRGILNGIGDALFAFINGVVEVLCRIGLPMLLVLIPGLGLWSIWWTAGVTWMISGLCCYLRYFAWRRKVSAAKGQ